VVIGSESDGNPFSIDAKSWTGLIGSVCISFWSPGVSTGELLSTCVHRRWGAV
jgi:hypothetical protein